jgi:hypothetical protein
VKGLARGRKAAILAAVCVAVVFTFSIVSPAVGGPSIAKVAKSAKKALSTAKKANSRASKAARAATTAQSTANTAQSTAATAQNTANAAAARGQITVVHSARVPYGPTTIVESATAFCPAGQRAVGGGGINIADQELAASMALSDRSGWAVIGVDLTDSGGEYIEAQALCAPGGVAVAASRSRALARVKALAAAIKRQVDDR